jgi:hypothetical protein
MFTHADLARLPAADFEVEGHRYGVYGHDWRVVPPLAWQELLAQREITAVAQTPGGVTNLTIQPSESILVLSQSDFAKAVKAALRDFLRPRALHNNLLLRSRFVLEAAATCGRGEQIEVLRNLIQAAAESLRSSARDDKFYRVLYRTYLNPAPTQEKAAELLNLPFSTYRRHLKSGITRLTDILWQQEIG